MAQFDTNPGSRSAAELEREVGEERERVSRTLDALQERASVGNIVDQVFKAVGENGGEMSRNLGRTLRDNPLPALLTGVGLAWLMAGSGTPRHRGDWRDRDDFDRDDVVRDEDFGGPDYGLPGGSVGYAATGREDLAGEAAGSGPTLGERAADTAAGVRERVAGLADSAAEGMARAGEAVRDAGHTARAGARSAGRSVRRTGAGAWEGFDELLESQPIVLGALALALGAAAGGAIPSSRTEDRMFGARSDRVKRAAREMVGEESGKAQATIEAVVEEAATIAGEVSDDLGQRLPGGQDMVDAASTRVEEAAQRLRDAGTAEAERQGLGQPKRPE